MFQFHKSAYTWSRTVSAIYNY